MGQKTVARAVKQSTSVINTVGHYVEKGKATFDAVQGQGALHVARQAQQAGAKRLIHIRVWARTRRPTRLMFAPGASAKTWSRVRLTALRSSDPA